MASNYTRQSSAQIVNGLIINDSDFNNEFNQLLAAFHGTTGHDHSGGTGLGPLINLTASTPGVTGVLDSQFGGVHTAAVDPTTSNGLPSYPKGSVWVNTATNAAFVCLVDTVGVGNAVWLRIPAGTTSGADVIPTVNNDISQGYKIGSILVNTTDKVAYICIANTLGAATWVSTSQAKIFAEAGNPGTSDDNTEGFAIGSIGVNTSTNQVFVAQTVGTGTATWVAISGTKPGFATNSSQTVGFTAVAGNLYPCDVTSAGFTATLPASAALNDCIGFIIFGTKGLTLGANGLKINGSTSNLIITDEQTLWITYSGASRGWV